MMRQLAQFGLLLILGVACQNTLTNIPTQSVTPDAPYNWWNSWLIKPICQPPCWQNIIPGETTLDEAVNILENSPDLTVISKSEYSVSWVFNQNKDEGGTLGAPDDGVVGTIWIGSASDKRLPVKTVVAFYNYPKYLKPDDCREGMCTVLLIYPDQGMFLSVYVENTGNTTAPKFMVLPDTSVDRIYFFAPGIASFQELSFHNFDLLLDWNEYREYP
jgi:hypothetical protein